MLLRQDQVLWAKLSNTLYHKRFAEYEIIVIILFIISKAYHKKTMTQ